MIKNRLTVSSLRKQLIGLDSSKDDCLVVVENGDHKYRSCSAGIMDAEDNRGYLYFSDEDMGSSESKKVEVLLIN